MGGHVRPCFGKLYIQRAETQRFDSVCAVVPHKDRSQDWNRYRTKGMMQTENGQLSTEDSCAYATQTRSTSASYPPKAIICHGSVGAEEFDVEVEIAKLLRIQPRMTSLVPPNSIKNNSSNLPILPPPVKFSKASSRHKTKIHSTPSRP